MTGLLSAARKLQERAEMLREKLEEAQEAHDEKIDRKPNWQDTEACSDQETYLYECECILDEIENWDIPEI